MNVNLVSFDPKAASRAEWDRFHRFRRARHAERDPGDPILGDEAIEAIMSHDDPFEVAVRFAVLLDGPRRQIGAMEFGVFRPESASYEANKHLSWASIEVLKGYRRRGIGTELLRRAAALAREHGKSRLEFWAEEDDGKAFLEAMKAAVVQKRRENRLEMSRVDWSLVHRWVEEGPRRSPRSILVWARNRIEDDSIEEFARAFTEVFNQQPFGDSAFRGLTVGPTEVRDDEARIAAARGTSLTAYTREPDGRISGLTTVWRFPDMKERITQGMTGVREAFRGRGLGKWLKAAMLLRIREEFPEARFIATGNATSNEAMLSINERLGFRTHKEPILAQASLDPLEAHLATMPTKVQLEGAA